MNRKLIYLIAIILVSLATSCTSAHYVSVRPGAPAFNRPPRPHPNYMWVDGNYYWRGGRYMYRPGYWAPPRVGVYYRPGGWYRTPRGYYWHRGGWRR